MSTKPDYKRTLITAALPYANGPLHIGHLAGAYLPADIYARYKRLKGEKVLFVCGSDEHGTAITLRAGKEGVNPAELVEKYHRQFMQVFGKLGISFDEYHRTSSAIHHDTASSFFRKLYDKGLLFEKESKQYYDPYQKAFLADRYITGTCPHCGSEDAYGDQCERCGTGLSPKELINPKSVLSNKAPELRDTTHWYFPLDKYENWLNNWIEDHKSDWKTNVYGQCKSWLNQKLQPRAFTRDLNWGVPVPVEGAEGKVLYVWVDAPVGYISATKAWAEKRAEKTPGKSCSKDDWKMWWQVEETELIHFIGKDNIFFHCLMFPAMLKAHGDYILPANVPANEFMNLGGRKISTSKNHAIWLHEFIDAFPDKTDVLRYALTVHSPETSDSDFNWKDFQERNNNELAAIIGNFVNRVIVLTNKYFDGCVPSQGNHDQAENIKEEIRQSFDAMESCLDKYRFREALQHAVDIGRRGNRFLNETEPWKAIKNSPEEAGKALHTCLQIAGNLALAILPFMPESAGKLADMLNIPEPGWNDRGKISLLKSGHELSGSKSHLFSRIEDITIQEQEEKLKKASEMTQETNGKITPLKAAVTFDDFVKLDLRAATIRSAEKVPKTKKLMKLELDTGIEKRTVVAGIAEFYSPEEVTGKQVCLVANLEPKKIRGIESHGMVLMAENNDGKLLFVSPENPVVNGAGIR